MAAIDVEDESILSSIFKESFPESWRESADFIQYLVELSSCGVEKLAREPERLAEEKAQILEETQDLAFHNYKTFIQTAECSREIFQDFQIIEKHVADLLEKLPSFSDECREISKKAQEINTSRRMNTLTLQRHTQLLEILEMPQLMDTCVRNGYYDEALELASHVKRLEKKHAAIPVIANIVNEVKNSTQLMLNQLIQQLRTNLQLPACLRVIGYLRRMDVFNEAELRIKFLQARDTWFQNILKAVPKDDPYNHITKTIEASRVHLFDIITQYRAIFSDEDPIFSTTKDTSLNEAALFHGWVNQKVTQFLRILEHDLARGVSGRLDSLLGQCMYFGLSFSRIGADFRGLLAPIFQRAALSAFQSAIDEGNKRFKENMESYSFMSSTSSAGGLPYIPVSQGGQLYPPASLMDYQPLAILCNHILTAFNDLRLCAPISLAGDVTRVLAQSLLDVNHVILAFYRAEETTFDGGEASRFAEFCSRYVHDLMPYINKCVQALFPPAQLAQILGVTASELIKLGNLGQIDIVAVTENIKHLVPGVEMEQIDESSEDLVSANNAAPTPQTAVTDTPTVPMTTQPSDLMESETTASTENVQAVGDQLSNEVNNQSETDIDSPVQSNDTGSVSDQSSSIEGSSQSKADTDKPVQSTDVEKSSDQCMETRTNPNEAEISSEPVVQTLDDIFADSLGAADAGVTDTIVTGADIPQVDLFSDINLDLDIGDSTQTMSDKG